MNREERSAIGKSTGITLGLAIVVIGAAVTAAWWFGKWTGADTAWKKNADNQLEAIKDRLHSIEVNAVNNRWTSGDQMRWTTRLQKANPDLVVPEPVVR